MRMCAGKDAQRYQQRINSAIPQAKLNIPEPQSGSSPPARGHKPSYCCSKCVWDGLMAELLPPTKEAPPVREGTHER